jgi:hypothetical protein
MAMLRRKLRVVALTWLVFQVAWLTALVPRDCCAAHRPAENCHESASATHCPMRSADGTPCPMHRGHSGDNSHPTVSVEHHHEAAPTAHQHRAPGSGHDRQSAPIDCRVTGACDGPMSALFALLSNHGILPESAATVPHVKIRHVDAVVHDHLGGQFQPPEPPPPRA